jgi:hypothetical protein
MADFLKRYRLIFPSEHGSWSLMIIPFIIGAGVAALEAVPGAAGALALTFAAAMAVFLARQPAALLLRIRRGRGRRADAPAAWFWLALLGLIAAAAGAGLLALGRWPVLWLAVPAAGVLALTQALTVWKGPRLLAAELIGVAGLALAAPAAHIAGTGVLSGQSWLVWAVSAAHSVTSVLYVRLRIDEQHRRATTRQALWVIAAHTLSLLAVTGAMLLGWLPSLIALPVALLLVRALAVAWRRPAIGDVRRFGFAEIGAALVFAALVIAAFAAAQ